MHKQQNIIHYSLSSNDISDSPFPCIRLFIIINIPCLKNKRMMEDAGETPVFIAVRPSARFGRYPHTTSAA